jgi:hypothetical protein
MMSSSEKGRTKMLKRNLLLGLGSILLVLAQATSIRAEPSRQSSICRYYADNAVSTDGDGSWSRPWKDIRSHLGQLAPGDTLCVRGDISGSGRVYETPQIYVNSVANLVRNGEPGAPITLRAYPGERVVLKNVGDVSTLYFKGADYWVVEGFVIDNNGRNSRAIRFEADSNYNILRNNEIRNGTTDGVALCCGRNIGNLIEGNHIHHFDAGDKDAHGIVLNPGSDYTTIQGNVIHDCSGDGIQIYADLNTPLGDYSKNVVIVDNVLYRGGLARGEDGFDLKGVDGLEASGNELYGYSATNDWSGDGRAIVVQMGSRNTVFERNHIHDASYAFGVHSKGTLRPANIVIENNVMHDLSGRYAILFDGVSHGYVYHNTIVNAAGASVRVEGNGIDGGAIQDNLVYNSAAASISGGAPFNNVARGYNGWFQSGSEFIDSTDITGNSDPGFVNASHHDYRPTRTSPARDAGIDVGVGIDYEGNPRPFGDRPDIGAYEYLPALRLTAIPLDQSVRLYWTLYEDPALATYVISYTQPTGAQQPHEGPSPIINIPSTAQSYLFTGLTNYAFYTFTIAARAANDTELATSVGVRSMPTDIFVYLPIELKQR